MRANDRGVELSAGVRLRPAEPADAEAGADLHRRCWREAYTGLVDDRLLTVRLNDRERWVNAWREQLVSGPQRWLAEVAGELIGFAVAGASRDDEAPAAEELYAEYVRAAWHGSGVGQALLARAIGDRAASLWVLENNHRARGFYARNGFAPDGAREHYAGLDAWEIRMTRPAQRVTQGTMRP